MAQTGQTKELRQIFGKFDLEFDIGVAMELSAWASRHFGGGGSTGKGKGNSQKGKKIGRVTWWNLLMSVDKEGGVSDFKITIDGEKIQQLLDSKDKANLLKGGEVLAHLVEEGHLEDGRKYYYTEVAKVCQAKSEEILGKKANTPQINGWLKVFLTTRDIASLKKRATEKSEANKTKAEGLESKSGGESGGESDGDVGEVVEQPKKPKRFAGRTAKRRPVTPPPPPQFDASGDEGGEEEEVEFE